MFRGKVTSVKPSFESGKPMPKGAETLARSKRSTAGLVSSTDWQPQVEEIQDRRNHW